MKCPCEGKNGLELASCLAPPEGEYETEIRVSNNIAIVANRRGVFVRRTVADDFLPFVRTITRAVNSKKTLRAYGVSLDRILCENVKGIRAAAAHGSRIAAKLLEDCYNMIRKIESNCRPAT